MTIGDGRVIVVQFDEDLVGDVTGYTPIPAGYTYGVIDSTGATITSLNQYNDTYSCAKAFDGNTDTYWRGTTLSNWITIQYPEPKTVTRIRLYLASYWIADFNLCGSNDGEEWVNITGTLTTNASSTGAWYPFEITNSTAYTYYKMNTLTGNNMNQINIYEIELSENVPVGNEQAFTATFDRYTYVPHGTTYSQTINAESVQPYYSIGSPIDLTQGTFIDTRLSGTSIMLAIEEA